MLQMIALYLAVAVLALGALLAVPWRALFRAWAGGRMDDRRGKTQRHATHHAPASQATAPMHRRPATVHNAAPHHARSTHERSRHHSRHTLHHP